MLIKPLSVNAVRMSKPAEKDYSLHDGFGLLLYVSKAGGKTWRFRYNHPVTKKRQTYTIGRYPYFTLAEAREEREKLRRLVARGIDPGEDKRAKKLQQQVKLGQTFGFYAGEWLTVVNNGNIRDSTIYNNNRVVNKHLIPTIGKYSIHEITPVLIISAFKPFKDKPAVIKKMIFTAKAIMDFSVNSGVISHNPISSVQKAFPAIKHKPQTALDINKLPKFIAQWDALDIHPSPKNALKFQILTMVRPNEAFNTRWDEIDLEQKLWSIPAERMKSNRPHVVPLSDQAIEVIKKMDKIRCSEYVFYASNKTHLSVRSNTLSKMASRHPMSGEFTFHGFRSMWSTLLNEEGFNPDIIEAALAHKSGNSIRDIYNRSTYLKQRKIMMQWVGDIYASAQDGVIDLSGGRKNLRAINS